MTNSRMPVSWLVVVLLVVAVGLAAQPTVPADPLAVQVMPADPDDVGWLSDLLKPATLVPTALLLVIAGTLIIQGRQRLAPTTGNLATPKPERAWSFIRGWAPVIGVFLTLLAIIVSSLVLTNVVLQQARRDVIQDFEGIGENAMSRVEHMVERISDSSDSRLRSTNNSLSVLSLKMDELRNDFNDVARRMEYLSGRVDSLDAPPMD